MFQFSVEIAIVSRNGIWVTKIVKISAGSRGPRRRHRSLFDRVREGAAVSAAVTALMVDPPRDGRRRADDEMAPAWGGRAGTRPTPATEGQAVQPGTSWRRPPPGSDPW